MRIRFTSKARMVRALRVMPWLVVFLLLTTRTADAQQATGPPRTTPVRIFLDCGFFCDEDFLKREITFVDYMRDRKDADVHVLITTQDTGGGGTEYTLKFIGLGPFAGIEQTLRYASPQTATADERRETIAGGIKQGLVRDGSEAPPGPGAQITVLPEGGGGKPR